MSNNFVVEKSEFDRNYAQNNPSFFSSGEDNKPAEKKYKVVPVSEDEKSVLVVTDGELNEIQKDYPSAKPAKDLKLKNPRGFGGDVAKAEQWLKENSVKKPQTEKEEKSEVPKKEEPKK